VKSDGKPLRFYDNRQKYLMFVTTCNEKVKVAERAIDELKHITPSPPALRIFDAGIGDGSLLRHVMRAAHKRFPTVPLFVAGKEISLEDIRLSLDKLPDRFVEHPASVVVFTNMYYSEAPWLQVAKPDAAASLNWIDVPLSGDTAVEFGEQLHDIDPQLVDGWQVRASEKTGNPLYAKPSVLVLYREDHKFILDTIRPVKGERQTGYDLVLVSQPWRARTSADFKVSKVLEPMIRCLAPGGRAVVAQSSGNDPGLELIRRIWPEADPFKVSRHELRAALIDRFGEASANYGFHGMSDAESILSYQMHTLPDEIHSTIGTSTLFAAWNAAIYVAQIEDERLESVLSGGEYLQHTEEVLRKYDGLWFNDEVFVISRNSD